MIQRKEIFAKRIIFLKQHGTHAINGRKNSNRQLNKE